MRSTFLAHVFVAAVCLSIPAAAAIEAAGEEKTGAGNQTVPFHRTGRAFLPDQGCSLVVGKAWHKQTEGDSIILHVPGPKGQKANIIISVWDTQDSLEKFTADSAAKAKEAGYKVSEPEPFETFSDLKGLRLRAGAPDGERLSIQYLFPAWEGRILSLTGSFQEKEFAGFGQTLALSLKTLHLLDRPHNLPAEPGLRFGDKRASLQVPRGWDARADVAGTNAFSPPVIHHGEQLFLKLELSDAPLPEFASAHSASADPAGIKLEEFPTAGAGTGIKIRGRLRMEDGQDQRTATYYFDGPPGLKVIIGTAANVNQWPAIGQLFDACVKTLQIGK